MYDVLPPGYGYYGRTIGSGASLASAPKTITIQQAVASAPLAAAARAAYTSSSSSSSYAPLTDPTIPDFATWNVGAGMIEKRPAKKKKKEEEETPLPPPEPWYMSKALWAVGAVALVGGYFFLRRKQTSTFAGFGG
jgi:hypothetical protein